MTLTVIGDLDLEAVYPLFKVDKEVPCDKDTHAFYGILFQDQYVSHYNIAIYPTLVEAKRRYDELENFTSLDPVEYDRITTQYRQLAKFTPVRANDDGYVKLLRFVKGYECNNRVVKTYNDDEEDDEFLIEEH